MLSRPVDKSQIPVAGCYQIFCYASLCKLPWQLTICSAKEVGRPTQCRSMNEIDYFCFGLSCTDITQLQLHHSSTAHIQRETFNDSTATVYSLVNNALSVVVPAHYCTLVVLISAFCSCQCFAPFCYVLNCLRGIFPP